LSKVFKSHQCVEATPCRVDLLDQEAFFIRSGQETDTGLDAGDESYQEDEELDPVEAAQLEAQAIVERARAEAEGILAAALEQATQIKNEARISGKAEGYQTGLTNIRQELSANLTQALVILSEAETEKEQRILASEPEILKLAVAIAEKVLHAELRLDPERQLVILKNALARFFGAANFKIRVNPADLEHLSESGVPELQAIFSEPKNLEFMADPGIGIGGCYIETELGNIDARLKSQLQLVLSELLKVGQLP